MTRKPIYLRTRRYGGSLRNRLLELQQRTLVEIV